MMTGVWSDGRSDFLGSLSITDIITLFIKFFFQKSFLIKVKKAVSTIMLKNALIIDDDFRKRVQKF